MKMKKDNDTNRRRLSRLEQKFKILLHRSDFQSDVIDFRKKWDIDPDKLEQNNNEEDWWNTHYNNADKWRVEEWPKYREELVALETAALDIKNEEVNYKQYLDRKQEIDDTQPINSFYKDLRAFLYRYQLPPRFERAIQVYIFTNKPSYYGMVGPTLRVSLAKDDEGYDKDEVSVVLDAYTTRQDLIDEWPTIKFHLDKLRHKQQSKFQPIDEEVFNRNHEAYELKQKGKKYKEIADILSDKYDKVYSYDDVSTMIRNYKKLSGSN